MRRYKYLDIILALFVCILLTSNIVSSKIISLGFLTFDGGTILFPLSYIFGDILTEVYGYQNSRKIIWLGFGAALIMSLTIMAVGFMPASPERTLQNDYMNILGFAPRLVLASLLAYLFGEFVNSYILAKMKIFTKGKYLWTRTIGSTIIGELLDTVIFIIAAFGGIFSTQTIIALIISNYIIKVGIEIIFTPLTYKISSFLKKSENEDYYDYNTDFNPFILK